MLLTKDQQRRFWRDWQSACRSQGWTAANSWTGLQIDNERHSLLRRAGFNSLTEVDRGPGFDRVLAELGQLQNNAARTIETLPAEKLAVPAGRQGYVFQRDTPGYRRRLLWLVRKHSLPLGGEPYVLALARDKFRITAGLSTIEDLSTVQLHQLMMTLNARRHTRAQRPPAVPATVLAPVAEEATADCPF